MAGLKEIRRRIKSVENTRKITRAMKLVSAAKLRKAQDAVVRSHEYTSVLMDLLHQLQAELGDRTDTHPLMVPHAELKKVLLVVIGGTKGLCGPFNANVNRRVLSFLANEFSQYPDVDVDALLLGKKPLEFFRREGLPYSKAYTDLAQDPMLWPADEISASFESQFLKGELDEVYLVYTNFRSAVSMTAVCERLLPLQGELLDTIESEVSQIGDSGVTLFEPSAEQVFASIIPRVVQARLQQACLSSVAGEHGSRMSAMDAATTNANDLLDRLRLKSNKLRQSGITGEILDIVGGSVVVD